MSGYALKYKYNHLPIVLIVKKINYKETTSDWFFIYLMMGFTCLI